MTAFRLPSLDALLAFEACARLGSFDAAGGELALTASAIAKPRTINRLIRPPFRSA